MKKKIALATLAMLPLGLANASATGQTGVVTTSSLNIRSGPSTNYSVITTAKKNDKVTILDSSNGWYKVKLSSGKEGWASGTYISKVNESSQEASTNQKRVTASSLNMRSGAGTSYRVITTLKKGVVVDIISESNGWSKIKYDGRIGYASNEYLESIKVESNQVTQDKQVNTASLNVRSGPSTSYSIVGKLSKGQKVAVLSEDNGWSKIKYNDKIAYVSSTYLSNITSEPSQPESKPENPNPETPEVSVTKKEVNTEVLNVRSGAGTNYSVVGKLNKGQQVDVISESNGWSKIQYNGNSAYVSSTYLSNINDQTSKPETSPEEEPELTPDTNPSNPNQGTTNGNINYNELSYTLNDHIGKQLDRVSVGGNVIDSSKPRSSEVMTTFNMTQQSRAFINADASDIEYFLNPGNFTSSSRGMMQFLRIDSYKEGITEVELNNYLNSLAPTSSGTNVFYNQGASFINAAKKYNIDLAYLVSHAMWETGYGKSTLAQGQTITSFKGQQLAQPATVYNFFGIGAIDGSANLSGAEAAYSNGWTSIEATIDGSAKWISSNYIQSSKYNQNTIYKMKWNYDYTWHQYATDVNWANGISGIMNTIVKLYDSSSNLIFEVPKYR